MFERIDLTSKKSVQVAEQILAVLRSGTLKGGDRLPTEREMGEQLGVSRTVLREALSALQLAGYLGSRPGYGHYVKRMPGELEVRTVAGDGLEAGLNVVQALEARAALDVSVAYLAVWNASDEDLAKAESILQRMEAALQDGEYNRYALLSLDFHQALADSTGNGFLSRAVANYIDVVRKSAWVIARGYDPSKGAHSIAVHRQMLEGVRERDAQKAVEAVMVHYRDYPGLKESQDNDMEHFSAPPARPQEELLP